jgi:membrane protease YdiL (CAAX protease family)
MTAKTWVTRHQIAAFLILVFLFLLAVPVLGFVVWPRLFPMSRIVALYVTRLAIYGPALAGLTVVRIASDGRRDAGRGRRGIAFLVSWAVAAVASVVYHQRVEPLSESLLGTLIRVAPIAVLPAVVISGAFSSVAAVRTYLSSLVRPRGNWAWYLIAVLTFPAIHVLGTVIAGLLHMRPAGASWSVPPGLALVAALTFVRVFFYTGGINEECGWRGFMLPRLQAKFPPLVAGLVIWPVHMVWELPGDLLTSGAAWPVLGRLVLMPCWSILFLWVYNRTGGSIMAAVLFHASMNAMNPLMGVFPVSVPVIALLAGAAIASVLWDRMWVRLPEDHRAVYREPSTWAAAD